MLAIVHQLGRWIPLAAVVIFTVLPTYAQQDPPDCPTEVDPSGIRWPQSSASIDGDAAHPPAPRRTSDPWCLDDLFYLRTRKCINTTEAGSPLRPTSAWLPSTAPTCPQRQPQPDSYQQALECPPDMLALRARSAQQPALCAHLSAEAAEWSQLRHRCLRFGSERRWLGVVAELLVIGQPLRELVQRAGHSSVWLPAQWIEPNRLLWQLAGNAPATATVAGNVANGSLVEQLDAFRVGQPALPGIGCAALRLDDTGGDSADDDDDAADVVQRLLTKRECSDELPMLCVYAEAQPLVRLACGGGGARTTRYAHYQERCYAVISQNSEETTSASAGGEGADLVAEQQQTSTTSTASPEGADLVVEVDKYGNPATTSSATPLTASSRRDDETSSSASAERSLLKIGDLAATALAMLVRDAATRASTDRCTFDGLNDTLARYGRLTPAAWQSTVGVAGHTPGFVNWDSQSPFAPVGVSPDRSALVMDGVGRWWWTTVAEPDDFQCSFESYALPGLAADEAPPQLLLDFKAVRPAASDDGVDDETELRLVVVRPERLWRSDDDDGGVYGRTGGVACFGTDADQLHVRSVPLWLEEGSDEANATTTTTPTNRTYTLRAGRNDSGIFWCEALRAGSMESVRSSSVYVDGADWVTGSVWLQLRHANATVDLAEQMGVALALSGESAAIRVDAVQVVRSQSHRRDGVDLLRLWFRAAITFTPGPLFEPPAALLQFTDADILRAAAKIDRLLLALAQPPFLLPIVNSTAFCLPEYRPLSARTVWPGARLGEVHRPVELCLIDGAGRSALRGCVGSAATGAMWRDLTRPPCLADVVVAERTQQLHNMSAGFRRQEQTGEIVAEVRQLMLQQRPVSVEPMSVARDVIAAEDSGTEFDALQSFDVVSIGDIMHRAARLNHDHALPAAVVSDVLDIYDALLQVDADAAQAAAQLNATNRLLQALGAMMENVSPNDAADDAAAAAAAAAVAPSQQWRPNVHLHWLAPRATNVSGLAVFGGAPDATTGRPRVQPLYSNHSADALLAADDLLVAVLLPPELLRRLPPLGKVLVVVYASAVLFQSGGAAASPPTSIEKLMSQVISVSIPNVDTTQLPHNVSLFFGFNASDPEDCASKARFWPLDNRRSWLDAGVALVRNSSTVVQFEASHLTNFAFILRDKLAFSAHDSAALDFITLVGCSLSLVGIVGIFLTALRFAAWRTKASNRLLLQLSASLAAMLLLFLFADNRRALANRALCIALGALLHYMVLVTFMWMLVMAYLQFMRYVVVFVRMRSERYVLKLSAVGWLVPMVPVVVVLAVDPQLYVPAVTVAAVDAADDGEAAAPATEGRMCYPSGYALYAGLMAPIGLIVLCNVLVFVSVIYNLLRVQAQADRSIVLAQLRVSTFLFFLLGLTWIFGFFLQADGTAGVLFAYLFCVTATLQGLVLFVYFVLLEPVTRAMWSQDVRRLFGGRRKGSMTLKTSA